MCPNAALGQRCSSVIVLLVLSFVAANYCLPQVSGFQVVSLKQQRQQNQQHHAGEGPLAPTSGVQLYQNVGAASTALAVRAQHKRHNLGQELNLQQQTMLEAYQMNPKSQGQIAAASSGAKSNHRLVSKLKDARHRRRHNRHNRHNRHHRHHFQKIGATVEKAGGSLPVAPLKYAQPSAAAAAAFAAISAIANEPAVQAASSTALTALESIVEEVARAGQSGQSPSGGSLSVAPQSSSSPSSSSSSSSSSNGSSPSISSSDLLLNGSLAPMTSVQAPQQPPSSAPSSPPQPPPPPPPPPQAPPSQQQQSPSQAAPVGAASPSAVSAPAAMPVALNYPVTRGPLHSTRSFLLTSTLSKIYNLLNVTEFALEMRDGISSRASCVACNAVVGLFLSPLYSKEVFSAAIRTVCISFRIQSARVCAGLVESFQDDFEYIRKNTKLTRDEVCGVVFGVECARRQTYNLFWTVPIPDMPAQLAAASSPKRPAPSSQHQQDSSTSAPTPMDEHGPTPMDDAPDLFEYRKSSIAAAGPVAKEQAGGPAKTGELQSAVSEPKASEAQQPQQPQQLSNSNDKPTSGELGGAVPSASNKLAKSLKRPQYIFDEQRSQQGQDAQTAGNQLSTFVHLTDIHIDPYYEPGSLNDCNEPLCCRATSGPAPNDKRRQAGRWGDYGNCDVPVRTLRNALQRIREKHANAEYWLWTGDISPHDIWNISKAEAANHVRLVTKLVRDYSNGLPVFPVIGNHEAHPVNSFSPPEIKGKFSMSWLYDLLADEWSEWLPEEAIRTLRIGGYYKLQVRKGLRILALNTNYCARLNPWSFFDPVDPAGQLKWLVDELVEAELNQDRVHIIGHVPPDNRECTQSWLFNFINIVDRFRDTILAQFYGHTHRDEWRVIYSLARADDPIGIQYIGPSITPFTENNPAYRIYHQDKQGYIHDSETFYFNLTEANETPTNEPNWRFSYSHKYHLNMTQGLDAQSFHQYLQKLHEDEETFDMFHKNFYRYSDVKAGQVCKNKCKQQLLSDLRLSHPYKTKPKPFLANRKTSNHRNRDHHHHRHHKRLRHQD